jgi:DNA-binding CsgD family transcriptional regulator
LPSSTTTTPPPAERAAGAATASPLDLATLRAFSTTLLKLSDVARTVRPNRFVHDALQALRPLLPFRAAWWGECSDATPGQTRRNWLHGRINLSATFAQEWNRLADGDVFASDSMRQLGVMVRSSGYDDPDPAVDAFSRRHGLFHAMAVTVELPGSGLMFFVSMYRSEDSPAFDERDGCLLEEFMQHLLSHWHARVQELLRQTAPKATDAFALADDHGNLLYLGNRLGRLLHATHPQWTGSALPVALTPALKGAPATLALGGQQLTVQACGELWVLSLEGKGQTAGLAPRERSVALLYAQGRSYKEIARLLGLSPATVRTYLRNAYLQLGVRNKVELGSALHTRR